MQVDGKTYYFESDYNGCMGCVAQKNKELCEKLNERVDCVADDLIWKETKESADTIKQTDDVITIENITYKGIPEKDGCKGCVGNGYSILCEKLVDEVDCFKKEIIWKEVEEPVSIKKDVEEWVAAGMPDTTNQTAGTKYDAGKLQYSLVPPYALAEVARNLTAGLEKYKQRNNWQLVPNAEQRYLDALYRHLEAHRRGEIYDTDSTTPNMYHLSAVIVNAMFLLEFLLDDKLKTNK